MAPTEWPKHVRFAHGPHPIGAIAWYPAPAMPLLLPEITCRQASQIFNRFDPATPPFMEVSDTLSPVLLACMNAAETYSPIISFSTSGGATAYLRGSIEYEARP